MLEDGELISDVSAAFRQGQPVTIAVDGPRGPWLLQELALALPAVAEVAAAGAAVWWWRDHLQVRAAAAAGWPKVAGSVVLLDNAAAIGELLCATGEGLVIESLADALRTAAAVVVVAGDGVPEWVPTERPVLRQAAGRGAAQAMAPLQGIGAKERRALALRCGCERPLGVLLRAIDAFAAAGGGQGGRGGPVLNSLKPPTGVLLHGPQAGGKSLCVTLAREQFASLPFFVVPAPGLFSKFLGETEENLRKAFRVARRAAPSVLVLEAIEAVGARRPGAGDDGGGASVTRRTLAALLCEMDGVGSDRGVLVVGTTARPMDLDAALVRQGRLETVIEVGHPSPDECSAAAAAIGDAMPFDSNETRAAAVRKCAALVPSAAAGAFRGMLEHALDEGRDIVEARDIDGAVE